MKAGAEKDLNAHASRIVRGYTIALAMIGVVLLASYFSLNKTLLLQGQLNKLYSMTSSVQIALRTTYDRATDLKEALREGDASRRLLSQIRKQLNTDLTTLTNLHENVQTLINELSGQEGVSTIQSLYTDEPFSLNTRLEDYIERLNALLDRETTDASSESLIFWVPIDASGAYQGALVTGYKEAFSETKKQLESHSSKLQVQHTFLTTTIAIALLLVSLLIFIPLFRGLRRVHAEVLEAQKNLEYLAFHDPVTDLPNSAGITRLQGKEVSTDSTCILLIRITNMAQISNLIGPMNHNLFFNAFSDRLKNLLPRNARMARTGDTEFSAFFVDSDFCDGIISSGSLVVPLHKKLDVNDIPTYPILALGINTLTENYSIDDQLANARLAASSYRPYITQLPLFETTMRDELDRENKVADEIRDGLQRNQFIPFYQLKVDSKTRLINGMEALVRWQHPEEGLVSPNNFIPVAERRGLIVDLTWSLFSKIADDYINWWNEGLKPGHVAINVAESVLQDPEFCNRLDAITKKLADAGIPDTATPIEIEITENVALATNSDEISKALQYIRDQGIPIAFDDFGTGFASLSSVVNMDLDVIKIDQSFVMNMTTNIGSRSVVESILSICDSLNKISVAEGVETIEQAELLTRMNCNTLQGYYFHKPAAHDSVTQALRQKHQLRHAG